MEVPRATTLKQMRPGVKKDVVDMMRPSQKSLAAGRLRGELGLAKSVPTGFDTI